MANDSKNVDGGNNLIEIRGDYEHESNLFHEIVEGIKDSLEIQISKSLFARGEKNIDLGLARSYLPLSGHSLRVKQKGKGIFSIRSIPKANTKFIGETPYPARKIDINSMETVQAYFDLLRLSQLALFAHSTRAKSEDESRVLPLPIHLIDALECLESFLEQRSDAEEIKQSKDNLIAYHKMWYDLFNLSIDTEGLKHSPTGIEDFTSYEYEIQFCQLPLGSELIEPSTYLLASLDDSITGFIQEVIEDGLRQMYVITPPENNAPVTWQPDPLRLRLKDSEKMYDATKAEAKRLLSLIGTDKGELKARVRGILDSIEGHNKIQKLVNHPPKEMNRQLSQILLQGDFEDLMEEKLKRDVPGIYEKRKESKDNKFDLKSLFTETEGLRNDISSVNLYLDKIDRDIDSLRSGHDVVSTIKTHQGKWAEYRKDLSVVITKKQDIDETSDDIENLRTKITDLDMNIKKSKTNVKTDGSVLWLGLGQAGQSILRECLLYCLDNLNDARCSALVRSLGVSDINQLKGMMWRSKSPEFKDRQKAETQLKEEFHRNLHVLAMNLGGEIDDLVDPDQPGFFLWGSEVPEPEYSSVRRKTMNTIKLDPTQDGAGGKTGVGRAFGFGRANEIKEALTMVGKKNGNSPTHIIVSHSFAGGSGSGMVLPVLQLLRSIFDADAMIWVVSVGEGLAENRISAAYNTPFILSDVLQAHYDGIHSAIDPFRVGEWEGNRTELTNYFDRMNTEINNIKTSLNEDGVLLTKIAEQDSSKAYQIEKKREKHLQGLPQIFDNLPEMLKNALPKQSENKLKTESATLSYSFENLALYLPTDDSATEAFNNWCEEYDLLGERPALKFWNWWVNYAVDPLGLLVDCRPDSKQQRADRKDDRKGVDYSPNLTSAHIEWALNEAEIKLFPDQVEVEEKQSSNSNEPTNIRMLVKYIVAQVGKEDNTSKRTIFDAAKKAFLNYGREVDGFNTLRRDLTLRVKALSKAGDDNGIKSIVISNAHLERGVSKSNIPVEENTYTVYNAVVFDIIMNIIGSQLPSSDYISGKMEYFDRQDLTNHTQPPMVVGLLQQNDALSLAEPPVSGNESSNTVRNIPSNINPVKLFDSLFLSKNRELIDGIVNPFASVNYRSGGWPAYFFSSFFGIRTHYMLQFNPYDLISQKPKPELESLIEKIQSAWEDPNGSILGYSFDERQSFRKNNTTCLTFVNMIRWLTTIDSASLRHCLKLDDFQSKGELDKYTVDEQEFVYSEVEKNFQLTRYEHESGSAGFDSLRELFPRLGLHTEEILAAAPPSLLTSYLPLLILQKNKEKLITNLSNSLDDYAEISELLVQLLTTHYQPTNQYDNNTKEVKDLMQACQVLSEKGLFKSLQSALSDVNLTIKISQMNRSEPVIRVCLHPRLNRYISVFRDVVFNRNSKLYPSKSAAGNLTRYIAADSPDSVVGDYGSPTFTRAVDSMSRLGFVGLLPDESRFSWPSFLRMILFARQDSETLCKRIQAISEVSDTDIDKFKPLIDDVLIATPLNDAILRQDGGPESVWTLGDILLQRITALDPITEEYIRQHPEEEFTINHWKERTREIREESPPIYDESSLSYFLQFVLQLIATSDTTTKENKNEQASDNQDSEAETDSPTTDQVDEEEWKMLADELINIDRLLYEIATNLNEMLSQAEYMSKEHSANRVHFQMNGFTDRMIGKPTGLLVQVHTASTYRQDFDMVKTAIRSSVQESVGAIHSTKEFQTKSHFGPRASVTMSLAQAPINEAASTYKQIMKELAGNDPEAYLKETKLHPYVFLYNILWLSARIDAWTSSENIGFVRRFVIPLQVIEDHYQQPGRIDGAVQVLAKDSVFLKGISIPQDDIRDYHGSKNINERFRSIRELSGILALRHVKACESLAKKDQQMKSKLEEIKKAYGDLITLLEDDIVINRAAENFSKSDAAHAMMLEHESLSNPDKNGNNRGTSSSDLSSLLSKLSGTPVPNQENKDTIDTRTEAWLIARQKWDAWANKNPDV